MHYFIENYPQIHHFCILVGNRVYIENRRITSNNKNRAVLSFRLRQPLIFTDLLQSASVGSVRSFYVLNRRSTIIDVS